ncbi:D-alanyl-D-alanine carboxypeptidase/D-alanyl-D-alanine endopeptidase [Nocardioides euryhalodurans]|uniref:D-alanyl-D-alanine carboxypeptidase/D-alanyl-D-alanine endopeptidase n=1 Tax=Nocardioides euryhalodurans TaxID=2518370 RepID=UPI00141F97BF|nr:D-alanyl-D-alanine carboxypeptidase/D-alanyl-D-alanine-endopeptidase [Nocardioides euryhalodurans]
MSRRDPHHGSGRRPGRRGAVALWLPVVLVLVLVGGAVAAWQYDLGARWFGTATPDPVSEPAAVPPPEGLEVPALDRPGPVAAESGDAALAPAAVRRALAPGLRDRDLGRSVLAAVAPLEGAGPGYESGSGSFLPASTTKLVTAAAALSALGPDHRFETTVVGRRGSVTLVGGGDPFLASRPVPSGEWPDRADVVDLARQTARSLPGRRPVRVAYDASLFTGPAENPYWRSDYVPDGIVSPMSALWVDEGRDADGFGRVADPAAVAADRFAEALRQQGVKVTGQPRPATAPRGAEQLAVVRSAPLSAIVEWVLEVSDNEAAEVLAHQTALATGEEASFAGASRAVSETLRGLGVPMAGVVLRDGSGLSRDNRLTAPALLEVLRLAADPDHPELRPVATGLPVGGFTGSLALRFDEAPEAGVGRVRAKTGTLTGVSSLAGIATDLDGTPMAFVLAADRVRVPDTLDARQALDNLAGALGACRCSR